jgi:hypothetical protein
MSGVVPRYVQGPVTYTVVETIVGGQLVEARIGGVVGVAAAGSFKVLGVATKDATPTVAGTGTDAFGNPTLALQYVTNMVAVGGSDAIYPVTYSANAAFGDRLVATANGTVGPSGATPDARTIVGYCAEPAGVVIGTNAVGLAKITV